MVKNTLLRILFVIVVLAICAGLIYIVISQMLPDLIPVIGSGDTKQIEEYLRSRSSINGLICAAILQMVQVWSVFISGTPVQIAIGAVFGVWKGYFVCHFFTTLAEYLALKFLRRMGKQMDKWIPSKGVESKGFNTFLSLNTPPMYTVFVAYLVPIMSSGFFPLLAYKMGLEEKKFVIAVWFGSIMSVFLGCFCGEKLVSGEWLTAALSIAVQFVIAALAWIFRYRFIAFINKIKDKYFSKKGIAR